MHEQRPNDCLHLLQQAGCDRDDVTVHSTSSVATLSTLLVCMQTGEDPVMSETALERWKAKFRAEVGSGSSLPMDQSEFIQHLAAHR